MKKFLFILCLLFSLSVKASIKTCVNSGYWNDSTIWSPMVVPQLTDTAVIPVGKAVIIPATISAKPFSIEVYGELRVTGSLQLPGDLLVDGIFLSAPNTHVTFNGTSTQTISGVGLINLWDLNNLNHFGLDIYSNIDLYNNLTLDPLSIMNVDLSAEFTLKSSSTNTARILPIPVDAIIDGFFTQERWTGAVGYHMVGFTNSDFYCTTYDETVSGGINTGYYDNNLGVGRGGFIQSTNFGTVYSNSGNISRDVVIIPLTCSGSDTLVDGWNLVSNPFPCEIDIESPFLGAENTTEMFYVWDAVNRRYLWWKKSVGGSWSNQVASGQGFWVQALDNSSLLKINEDCKITSATYYRTTQPNDFNFKIKLVSNNNDTTWSIVRLNDNYLDGYEQRNDGLYLEGQGTKVTEVYTKTQNFDLVVDSRPFSELIEIPIWVKIPTVNTPTSYTTIIDGIENLPDDYGWYIKFYGGAISTSQNLTFNAPGFAGKNYLATIYIYKKPTGLKKIVDDVDPGELIAVYDQQGRLVKPESTGYYIYVYKTKEGNYIRKMKYIFD